MPTRDELNERLDRYIHKGASRMDWYGLVMDFYAAGHAAGQRDMRERAVQLCRSFDLRKDAHHPLSGAASGARIAKLSIKEPS